MWHSIVILLLLLLHSSSAEITTKLASRTCHALKVKCDTLPYRTVYFESNCYFAIDALADSAGTSKKCSLVLPGAQLARGAHDRVWSGMFADENDFLLAGKTSVDKKKAMCIYENGSPCLPNPSRITESTCAARAKEDEKFFARIEVWTGAAGASPLVVKIPEKIAPGQELIFKGLAQAGNDYTINLQSEDAKFVPLQIWILFAQRQIYLNSIQNWRGGTPDIKNHTLVINQPFTIVIRARVDHFKICIDGMDFAMFKYREPLSTITHFEIKGQGFLNSYHLGEKYTPFPSVKEKADIFPICNETTSKNECKSLVVSGTIGEFYRAYVNMVRKNGDIAAHVNFCFILGPGPCSASTNTYIGRRTSGQWWGNGDVVYNKPNPKKGDRMELEFRNGEKGFKIFLNGKFYADFVHLVPSFDIVGVETANLFEPIITFREPKEQKFAGRIEVWTGAAGASPLIVKIPEPIKPGQIMTFNGIALTGSNEFVINLQAEAGRTIQLQIYIFFSQRQVYLNSILDWRGGTAEILTHSLQNEQSFEVSIQALDDHFKIRIDGKDFAEYKYRQPLASITQFEIKGQGFVNSYHLGEQYKLFPAVTDTSNSLPICKATTPKNECKSLTVSGTFGDFYRSYINLVRQNGDIAAHVNICFQFGPGPCYHSQYPYIGRRTNGKWWGYGDTLYNKPNPKKGDRVELEFVNGEKGFQIFLNGQHYHNFTHLIPSFDIMAVETANLLEPVIIIK